MAVLRANFASLVDRFFTDTFVDFVETFTITRKAEGTYDPATDTSDGTETSQDLQFIEAGNDIMEGLGVAFSNALTNPFVLANNAVDVETMQGIVRKGNLSLSLEPEANDVGVLRGRTWAIAQIMPIYDVLWRVVLKVQT